MDRASDQLERELRESEAFDLAVGDAAVSSERLLIPARDIERYRRAFEVQRFPVDMLFRRVGNVAELTILDVGCGTGVWSTVLGLLGAHVIGADVSEAELRIAARRAEANGVAARVNFTKASVHDLPFAPDTFDVVFGNAILHHVDPSKAGAEIARVLRTGGRAVFKEPVALSLALRRLRKSMLVERFVADARISPDEEPLSRLQIEIVGRAFSAYRIHEMQMMSRLARIACLRSACRMLNELDITLFKICPVLRRFARLAILEFVK